MKMVTVLLLLAILAVILAGTNPSRADLSVWLASYFRSQLTYAELKEADSVLTALGFDPVRNVAVTYANGAGYRNLIVCSVYKLKMEWAEPLYVLGIAGQFIILH